MRNQTLADVTAFLKAEIGYTLTASVATAQDTELYTLLDAKQRWFASAYDWPFLDKHNDVTATVATRYLTLPTMNFERPVAVTVFWTNFWKELVYGISEKEYNIFSNGDQRAAQTVDPIMRWAFYDETQFEVWPLPVTQQVVRFNGQRTLTSLKTSGSYVTTNTFDLDDMLLVYSVAADKLAFQKHPAAQLVSEKATQRFNAIRGSYPVRTRQMCLSGPTKPERRVVGITVAAP